MTVAHGTKLGPYEVLSLLGAGGMGEVYRARDTRLARDVAIKVLPESVAKDEDRLRRFAQEARAISALNHPNILSIHDIGTCAGTNYIVTELLEGCTLRKSSATGRCRHAGLPVCHSNRKGASGRAREGCRPPGSQAREPVRDQGGARHNPRFRIGQVRVHRPYLGLAKTPSRCTRHLEW